LKIGVLGPEGSYSEKAVLPDEHSVVRAVRDVMRAGASR
jgi:hypothetical protein